MLSVVRQCAMNRGPLDAYTFSLSLPLPVPIVQVSRDPDALFQYLQLIPPGRYPALMANVVSEDMLADIGLVLRDKHQSYDHPLSSAIPSLHASVPFMACCGILALALPFITPNL